MGQGAMGAGECVGRRAGDRARPGVTRCCCSPRATYRITAAVCNCPQANAMLSQGVQVADDSWLAKFVGATAALDPSSRSAKAAQALEEDVTIEVIHADTESKSSARARSPRASLRTSATTSTHTCTPTRGHPHTRTRAYTCRPMHTRMRTQSHAPTRARSHARVCMCAHAYMYGFSPRQAQHDRSAAVNLHFIAFVPFGGAVYELDGRKPFPIRRAATARGRSQPTQLYAASLYLATMCGGTGLSRAHNHMLVP